MSTCLHRARPEHTWSHVSESEACFFNHARISMPVFSVPPRWVARGGATGGCDHERPPLLGLLSSLARGTFVTGLAGQQIDRLGHGSPPAPRKGRPPPTPRPAPRPTPLWVRPGQITDTVVELRGRFPRAPSRAFSAVHPSGTRRWLHAPIAFPPSTVPTITPPERRSRKKFVRAVQECPPPFRQEMHPAERRSVSRHTGSAGLWPIGRTFGGAHNRASALPAVQEARVRRATLPRALELRSNDVAVLRQRRPRSHDGAVGSRRKGVTRQPCSSSPSSATAVVTIQKRTVRRERAPGQQAL